jgi:phage gpG-like protein
VLFVKGFLKKMDDRSAPADKPGVRLKTDRVPEVLKAIRALTKKNVVVGITTSTAARSDGLSNAELGYIHNFGSPLKNIPQREFLGPGIDTAKDPIVALLRAGAAGVWKVQAPETYINQILNAVGLVAQTAVQMKITEGPFEPLKPTTIAARRRRGHQGSKPLIDSGQLRKAITYEIR